MSSSGPRRSLRILKLGSEMDPQSKYEERLDKILGSEGESSQRQRKRKSKAQVNHALSKKAKNSVDGVAVPTATPLPQTSALVLLLNLLKRRDTLKIFAEPVNPAEVRGYGDIVKHPMDLGTITAKLAQGSYSMLEEFEHDVYLVFSNAMLFNGSATVYYRQARAVKEVADKLFDALRADPGNFEMKFALAGLATGNWSKADARLINQLTNKNLTESGEGSSGASNLEDQMHQQPHTYNFWGSYPIGNEAPLPTVFNPPHSARTLDLINQSTFNNGQSSGQTEGLAGGWGPVNRMLHQTRLNNWNHGAVNHWHVHSRPPLSASNHHQIPTYAYPGTGLRPIPVKPFGNYGVEMNQNGAAMNQNGNANPFGNYGPAMNQHGNANPFGSYGVAMNQNGNVYPFINYGGAMNQNGNARGARGPEFGAPAAPGGGNRSTFSGMGFSRFSRFSG